MRSSQDLTVATSVTAVGEDIPSFSCSRSVNLTSLYLSLVFFQSLNPIRSFTMSIDRGLHGGAAKQLPPSNQNLDFNRFEQVIVNITSST